MRVVLLLLVLVVGLPAAAVVPNLVGSWRADDGEVIELHADGRALIGGMSMRWQADATTIQLSLEGISVPMNYQLAGDRLTVIADGEVNTLVRVGRPASPATPISPTPVVPAPPAPAGPAGPAGPAAPAGHAGAGVTQAELVGIWIGPIGSVILRADGSGRANGEEGRWSVQGGMLALSDASGQGVQVPVARRGEVLILGQQPSIELQRAQGVVGFWMGRDSSIDPSHVISITHRIAFLPDGRVAYSKGEFGANNRENWFSVSRQGGGGQQIVGQWQQQGGTVAFNLGSGRYQASFNEQQQRLVVHGMGQITDGSNVSFERE